jgi:outer membrane protein insertion porin family
VELLFPIPGTEAKDKRFSIFVDGGQVYGPDEDVDLSDMRFSTGIAFNWFSPLGPLSVSYGVPINDKDGDETENVQVTIGRFFR